MTINQTFYNYDNPLNLFAGILVLVNNAFGITCNSLIIYVFIKEKEKSSFNLMCLFRASISLYTLVSTFTLDFFPIILIGSSPYPPSVETTIVMIVLSLYLVNEYQTILVSLNRFIALYFPMYYDKLCGLKPTFVILLILVTERLVNAILNIRGYITNDCYVIFSSEYLTYIPIFGDRCVFSSSYIMIFTMVTFGSITVINTLTFFKIIKFYVTGNNQNSKESRSRIRRNIVLFFQTILQDSLYIVDLTFTFKLNSFSDARYWSFISGTFVWQCLHSFDGFIMIMFNERLSFIKKTLFTKSSVINVIRSAPNSVLPTVN